MTERTCVGCRRKADVDELFRVVADTSGRLVPGEGKPGRGAWLCRGSAECLRAAGKRNAFARALRTALAPRAVTALEGLLVARETEREGREASVCEDGGANGSP
ncbi:MAG: YlxR family protein [Actinobacteria bacterium]|nr:YlxR family protein [Actinomycetota bacterium]